MLVEPKDAGKTPIAGFFMNTEGGEELAGREKKQRIGVYMEKELVERADEMASYVGARSRNEFVAEAVKYYIGFLNSRKAENYLFQSLSSVLTSTVHDIENRLARMDFKLAVEISKLAHVIAYSHEVDLLQRSNVPRIGSVPICSIGLEKCMRPDWDMNCL